MDVHFPIPYPIRASETPVWGVGQKAELCATQIQHSDPLRVREPRKPLVTKVKTEDRQDISSLCVLYKPLKCALCYGGATELGRLYLKNMT